MAILKTVIHILMKITGIYLIANTLMWAFVGTGRFLYENHELNHEKPTSFEEGIDVLVTGIDQAVVGWKEYFCLCGKVIKWGFEDLKDWAF